MTPAVIYCDKAVPDPRGGGGGGGAKGAHAPPKRPQGIPCPPGKKLIIIDLMTPKASCQKKKVPVRVAHSKPIPTRL